MTDHNADRDANEAPEQSGIQRRGSELVPSGSHAFADDAPSENMGSKDITLHRLSAHSSWDNAFGDTRMFPDESMHDGSAAPAADIARRPLSLAAVVAIAALIGAVSGGAATYGVTHYVENQRIETTMAERGRSIEDTIAKFNADLAAVKANVDTTAKTSTSKIAKLSETLDKLKGQPAPETTASIPAPAVTPAPGGPQLNRLPLIEGWVLREIADGGATVEGRDGVYEVFAGDPLPGVGRVDAIRRQDGRWVVVTSRGLIVAR